MSLNIKQQKDLSEALLQAVALRERIEGLGVDPSFTRAYTASLKQIAGLCEAEYPSLLAAMDRVKPMENPAYQSVGFLAGKKIVGSRAAVEPVVLDPPSPAVEDQANFHQADGSLKNSASSSGTIPPMPKNLEGILAPEAAVGADQMRPIVFPPEHEYLPPTASGNLQYVPPPPPVQPEVNYLEKLIHLGLSLDELQLIAQERPAQAEKLLSAIAPEVVKTMFAVLSVPLDENYITGLQAKLRSILGTDTDNYA